VPASRRPLDGVSRLSAMMQEAEDAPIAEIDPADVARRRRRRRTGRIVTLVAVLAIVALVATYASLTLTAPAGAATSSVTPPKPAASPAATIAMPVNGESAISVSGADEFLGAGASGIFAANGGDAAMPMASISKLITAMTVLDHKPLGASGQGPTITFSKADHDLYDAYYVRGATIAPMPTGSTMTLHDAIETMLVVSASNYAEAVSTWAFGSQPAFVSAAKAWLRAHGLTHTTFVEPTGLDTRNASTPSDLIALGKLAKADPVIAAIVAEPFVKNPTLAGMPNTNPLLGKDGIDGLKTGTLEETGSNLLFSATVPVDGLPAPLTMIGVVLGGGSRDVLDRDVRALIASIKAGFHTVVVGEKGSSVGRWHTPWGSTAKMVLGAQASVFTWSDTPVTAKMTAPKLADGGDGDQVATVTWTAGTRTASAPVVLQGRIAPPSTWWRLTHPKELLHW
jgi:serine-type D-Ala-D-Ala carboxypeptidase (penicillin-binding protein 5/6)